ncbi:hypothetical protein BC830DRAFT_1141700 [Chytriomyces sp. MP71]|nr:hypothetical protein BC830DRAFT_1141700 [Chytriomyces sp. MP71]
MKFTIAILLAATSASALSFNGGFSIADSDIDSYARSINFDTTRCSNILRDLSSVRENWEDNVRTIAIRYNTDASIISRLAGQFSSRFSAGSTIRTAFEAIASVNVNVKINAGVSIGVYTRGDLILVKGVTIREQDIINFSHQFSVFDQPTIGTVITEIGGLTGDWMTGAQQIISRHHCQLRDVVGLANGCMHFFPQGHPFRAAFEGVSGLAIGGVNVVATGGYTRGDLILVKGVTIREQDIINFSHQFSVFDQPTIGTVITEIGSLTGDWMTGAQQIVSRHRCQLRDVVGLTTGCMHFFPQGHPFRPAFEGISSLKIGNTVNQQVITTTVVTSQILFHNNIISYGSRNIFDTNSLNLYAGKISIDGNVFGNVLQDLGRLKRTGDYRSGCKLIASQYNLEPMQVVQVARTAAPMFHDVPEVSPVINTVASYVGPAFDSVPMGSSELMNDMPAESTSIASNNTEPMMVGTGAQETGSISSASPAAAGILYSGARSVACSAAAIFAIALLV